MFVCEFKEKNIYYRKSKTGKEHAYNRELTICVFRCDNCNAEFSRPRGSMNPKRLNNNYFHVCSDCDAKVFAQKKGVERKQVWNLHASSDIPISKL